jgi:hypothetical protein
VSVYGYSYIKTIYHQSTWTAEDHQSSSRYSGSNLFKSFGIIIFDRPDYCNGVQPIDVGIINGSGFGRGYDADGQSYRWNKSHAAAQSIWWKPRAIVQVSHWSSTIFGALAGVRYAGVTALMLARSLQWLVTAVHHPYAPRAFAGAAEPASRTAAGPRAVEIA